MECPICGYKSGGGWSRCDSHVFEQVADFGPVTRPAPGRPPLGRSPTPAIAAVPAGVTLERRRPARAADLRSDVAVPCVQAAITGLLATGVSGGVAALVSGDVLTAGGVFGGLVTGVAWLLLLWQHRDLLWERETITGIDLDGDGQTGKSMTRIEVKIPATEQRGSQTKIIDLPATPEQLRTLAQGMLDKRMAEGEWCGKGKLFSKPKFYTLRQELIDRGLMVWVNPKAHTQGTELTAVGRSVFRRLAA